MWAPSREQAHDWPEIIGLLSGSRGMGCLGTLAKAAIVLLGWGVQSCKMSQAGGVAVIRNSARAQGCIGSPGVGWTEHQPHSPLRFLLAGALFSQTAFPEASQGRGGQSLSGSSQETQDPPVTLQLEPVAFMNLCFLTWKTGENAGFAQG